MDEITTFINSELIPHWPFVAAVVVFMVVGQVLEQNIFTATAYKTQKPLWLFWWGHKTLALQPIVLGILLGLVWKSPEVGMNKLIVSVGYFALAGGISIWGFEFLKGLAKQKGIDLDIPGVDPSNPPSADSKLPLPPPVPK